MCLLVAAVGAGLGGCGCTSCGVKLVMHVIVRRGTVGITPHRGTQMRVYAQHIALSPSGRAVINRGAPVFCMLVFRGVFELFS